MTMVANYMALHRMQALDQGCFRSVGRSGSGRGSVFRYSQYSMGTLRGEAHHNSWVGGPGGRAAALSLRKCSRALRGDAVPPIKGYRFGSVFVSVRTVLL